MATAALARRGWRPLAALVAVALLFAALLLVGPAGTDETRRREHRAWPDFRSGAVDRFELQAGDATTRFERRADGWWAGQERADPASVEELLVAVEFGRVIRRAEPSLTPAAAGLEPRRRQLRVAAATLLLGGRDPLGEGRFARRDGGEILIVDDHLAELLEAAPDGLRSRALVAGASPRQARVVEIGPLKLERDATGRGWRGGGGRADPARVEAILAALGDARALRFAAPGDGEPGADVIRIDGVERARLGGACGASTEVLVRRDDGARLCFAAAAIAPLRADPSSLRDLRPFPLAPAAVRSLSLERGGRRLLLERGSDGWRVRSGDADARPTPADEEAVRELLDALAAVAGRPIATDAVVRAAAPLGRLTAETQLQDRLTLDVIGTAASGYAARRDGDETTPLLVNGELLALLDPAPLRFRPRRVVALHAAELVHLTVDDGGPRLELVRPTPTSPWRATDDSAIDDAAAARLADALASLRATRYRALTDESTAPRALRRLTAGAVSLTLLRRDAASCLARLDGDAALIELPAASCADLLAPLRR